MQLAKLIIGALSVSCAAVAQPFGVGIVAGVPFTGGLASATQNEVDLIQRTYSDSNLYVIGAMVELRLPFGLGLEADGLYHPINFSETIQVVPAGAGHYSENYSSWVFPILAKYRFSFPVVKPFVEAGPSFRTVGSGLSWLSGKGFALGGGVELKVLKLRIAPELRYTHWGSDNVPPPDVGSFAPSQQNQGEFLVGFSF